MRVRRWMLTTGSAAVAAAALLGAVATASAQVPPLPQLPQTLVCQASAGGDFSPAMRPGGPSSGTYTVNTGGLVNASRCTDERRTVWPMRITTRGTFTASSCGTGVLVGDPISGGTIVDRGIDTLPSGGWSPVVTRMSYRLEVDDWQAVLRVSSVNGRPELGGDDVDGVFTIVPQHACLSQSVSWFTLDGSFTVSW